MRIKNSAYNSVIRLFSSIIPSILGLILNNLILRKFGADLHGLTGTIGQITVLLTLFESGYALAANVALYKPYLSGDWNKVNAILTAVKKIYIKVGIITAVVSVIFALAGPLIIKSALEYSIVSILIFISSVGTVLGLFVLSKYHVLFHAAQKEYKLSLISLALNVLSQTISIVLILNNQGIVVIRLVAAGVSLLLVPVTIYAFRQNFPQVRLNSPKPDYSILQSTKNVFAQKIASLVFSSTDMLVLSTFIGTLSTSVYAVYNMAFTFAKQILFSIILAPFNAFGQLSAEGDIAKVADRFRIFQFLSIFIINAILTTVMIIVLPFVSLYTLGVPNTGYVSVKIALLFGICAFLELLSNIYGLMANSAGMFSEMKKIAIVGSVVNIVVSMLLVKRLSVFGVLIGTVVSYIIMDSWQMHLVHFRQLNGGFLFSLKLICINLIVSSIFITVSFKLNIQIENYLMLLVFAVIAFAALSSVLLVVSVTLFHNEWLSSLELFKEILRKKGK